MKKIRIAQIGTGHTHAGACFNTLRKRSDLFDIVGVAEPEPERECRLQRETYRGFPVYSADEILRLDDLDAVTVETDEVYLTKYALEAAERGLHVHMDKPGGLDQAEFEKLIETVKRKKTVLHLGYMYRYNPYVQEIIKQVRNGEFGDVFSVEAQMGGHVDLEIREWLSTLPGGMMFFLGCHLIDLLLLIRGKPDEIVSFNRCTGHDGLDCLDYGMAVLTYPNGISFAKSNASEIGGFTRRQLVVTGTKKTVELKPFETLVPEGGQVTDRREYLTEEWFEKGVASRTAPFDRYESMMESFAMMAAGEKENPFTPDYELELYKTIMKCCKAE
ncbi:MAG: Gfo/Idh/MocA family oxidoreductase [Lachnospiraceae bacterium]|nr:Gfo/Idh/MocA family oxidoreductase [Lachnospiraceae bacterium]